MATMALHSVSMRGKQSRASRVRLQLVSSRPDHKFLAGGYVNADQSDLLRRQPKLDRPKIQREETLSAFLYRHPFWFMSFLGHKMYVKRHTKRHQKTTNCGLDLLMRFVTCIRGSQHRVSYFVRTFMRSA
jgi:hypothetical protein